jgi:general secretion pathway protein G
MRANNSGFTLIELILVMVIIGILAGAVSLNLSGRVTDANKARVQSDLKVYETAIDMYAIEHNDNYPKTLSELNSGERTYVKEVKNDPWGNPYQLKVPGAGGRPYDLFSTGKDGQPGTEDDITLYGEEDTAAAS